MKTKHFIALAFLALCLLHGQYAAAQMSEGHFRFGLKAGISGSSLYDDAQASDKSTRIGLTAGAFAKVPLGKSWSFRPELLIATAKGAKFTYANGQKPDVKLAYLELPLSLEVDLLSFLNLHAGLHASYLASADGKLLDAQGNPLRSFGKDEFEKLDYGWHIGTGLDFGNIGLHLRISRGLKDIKSGSNLDQVVGSLKNAAWALTFSLAL